MNYQEAIDALVTIDQAIAECAKHGIQAIIYYDWLLDAETGHQIARITRQNEIAAITVLDYLGY